MVELNKQLKSYQNPKADIEETSIENDTIFKASLAVSSKNHSEGFFEGEKHERPEKRERAFDLWVSLHRPRCEQEVN